MTMSYSQLYNSQGGFKLMGSTPKSAVFYCAAWSKLQFRYGRKDEQAGTELGQAQLKLGLGFTSTIDS